MTYDTIQAERRAALARNNECRIRMFCNAAVWRARNARDNAKYDAMLLDLVASRKVGG